MREALKGQVVAGLPTGGWRSESLANLPASLWPQPEAPREQPHAPVQHLDTSNPGAPVVFSGAGRGAPRPPERIPQFDRQRRSSTGRRRSSTGTTSRSRPPTSPTAARPVRRATTGIFWKSFSTASDPVALAWKRRCFHAPHGTCICKAH